MVKSFFVFILTAILSLFALLSAGTSAAVETIYYSYDRKGRIETVTYEKGRKVDYLYDPSGNRQSKTVSVSGPADLPPAAPSYSFPPDNSTGQPLHVTLLWHAASDPDPGDIIEYDIYLGTSTDPPLLASGIGAAAFTVRLSEKTRYYWRIEARDNRNMVTPGPVWSFLTTDDSDQDGIQDSIDNCPLAFNVPGSWSDINGMVHNDEQADFDLDGTGDACDADPDGDGVDSGVPDNCPFTVNPSQHDADSDGAGDDCDSDDDDDGIADIQDNCHFDYNPSQTDTDGDGQGDECDTDIDGDWISNSSDNCIAVNNMLQKDMDLDAIGDRCDSDIDGDGVDNLDDNCPFLPNSGQTDTFGTGLGDACTIYHCVSNAAAFQGILTAARSNGKNDIVQLEAGIYITASNGNLRFRYNSTEPYSIELRGGYSAGCSSYISDPTITILDGLTDPQNNTKSSKVIELTDSSNSPYEDWLGIAPPEVSLSNLSVRNGRSGAYLKSVNGDVMIDRCEISDSGGSSWGGLMASSDSGNIYVQNNVIRDNTSAYKAGAYVVTASGRAVIENNIISGNEAASGDGGGIYAVAWGDEGQFMLINNTLADNRSSYSSGRGGGMYIGLSGMNNSATLANNIFWNNLAVNGKDLYIISQVLGWVEIVSNDIQLSMVSGGYSSAYLNIYADPLFVHPSAGDYHIKPGSPVIDMADPYYSTDNDIEGIPRPIDGNGDSIAIPDIGAYEYYPSSTDSDNDGIIDILDNCRLTANPAQEDSDGDGYGNICDCDLDNDGFVGPNDFTVFGLAWWSSSSSPNWNTDADFDSDGFVGPFDYTIFSRRWWTQQPWY